MKRIRLTENRLRNIIKESVRGMLYENGGRFEIFPDGEYEEGQVFRPEWCYADGKLEDDLGAAGSTMADYFYLDTSAARVMGDNMRTGKYECQFNGRPCSLYYMNNGHRPEGYCCYDDDIEAKARILDMLF